MRIGDSFPKDNWRLPENASSCQILIFDEKNRSRLIRTLVTIRLIFGLGEE